MNAKRWAYGFVSSYVGVVLVAAFLGAPSQGSGGGIQSGQDATLGDITATTLDVSGATTLGDLDCDSISRVGGNAAILGAVNVGAQTNANANGELDVVHGVSGARFGVFSGAADDQVNLYDSTGTLVFMLDIDSGQMQVGDPSGDTVLEIDAQGGTGGGGRLALSNANGASETIVFDAGNGTVTAIDGEFSGDLGVSGATNLTGTLDLNASAVVLGMDGTVTATSLVAPGGLVDYAAVSGGSASFADATAGTLCFSSLDVAGDGSLTDYDDDCVYVVGEDGLLTVEARVQLASSAGWAAGEVLSLNFSLNGTNRLADRWTMPATLNPYEANVRGVYTVSVSVGDRVAIRVTQNSGGTILAQTAGTVCWATFRLVRQ